jgi:hypothetical protein
MLKKIHFRNVILILVSSKLGESLSGSNIISDWFDKVPKAQNNGSLVPGSRNSTAI